MYVYMHTCVHHSHTDSGDQCRAWNKETERERERVCAYVFSLSYDWTVIATLI